MPFGLLIVVQIAFAVHAYRTGRTQPWLYLILFLPGIGCVLYAALELAPALLGGRQGRQLTTGVVNAINPGRHYRTLHREVEIAPTVHNKRQLAEECLTLGRAQEAKDLFESSATGLHAADPGLQFGLARALAALGDFQAAATVLESLRRDSPTFRKGETHLLHAAALNGAGHTAQALAELSALVEYYPGEEARCRYAQLLAQTGATRAATDQFKEIVHRADLQGGVYRRAQREWYDIARKSLAA